VTVDEVVGQFCGATGVEPLAVHRVSLGALREVTVWPPWSTATGVYFFEQGGVLQYVGRALRTTLQRRLESQCGAFGDPRWDAVISDADTTVGVIPFPAERWYLVAALEALLIHELRPRRSRRVS
jgi:hypothetical protein